MDSWSGYDAPCERMLRRLEGLGNAVVDRRRAPELRERAANAEWAGEAVAVEFVGTSISSGGDGADMRAGNDRIMAENPALKFTNDRRVYMTCEATQEAWTTRFRVLDRVTTPGEPMTTAATITVRQGRPELAID